jgi:hypothetical protein
MSTVTVNFPHQYQPKATRTRAEAAAFCTPGLVMKPQDDEPAFSQSVPAHTSKKGIQWGKLIAVGILAVLGFRFLKVQVLKSVDKVLEKMLPDLSTILVPKP